MQKLVNFICVFVDFSQVERSKILEEAIISEILNEWVQYVINVKEEGIGNVLGR